MAATAAYVGVLYASLPVTPFLYRLYVERVGSGATLATVVAVMALAGGGAGWWYRGALRSLPRFRRFLAAGMLAALAGLVWLPQAYGTKLHVALYAGLAWLANEALRDGLPVARRYAAAAGFVLLVGAGDEAIQWALPHRHGLLAHVGLNAASGWLALALAFLLRR